MKTRKVLKGLQIKQYNYQQYINRSERKLQSKLGNILRGIIKTIYQYFWGIAQSIVRENSIAPNTCMYKKKINTINQLSKYPDQVVRKQQIKCRESRGEEMIKIATEINEVENKYTKKYIKKFTFMSPQQN